MNISPDNFYSHLQELNKKQSLYQTIEFKRHFSSSSIIKTKSEIDNMKFIPFLCERDHLGRLIKDNIPKQTIRAKSKESIKSISNLRNRAKSNVDFAVLKEISMTDPRNNRNNESLRSFSNKIRFNTHVLKPIDYRLTSYQPKNFIRNIYNNKSGDIPPIGAYDYDDKILKPKNVKNIIFSKMPLNNDFISSLSRNMEELKVYENEKNIYKSVPTIYFKKMQGRKDLHTGKTENNYDKLKYRKRDGELSEKAIDMLLKLRKDQKLPKVDRNRSEELIKYTERSIQSLQSKLTNVY